MISRTSFAERPRLRAGVTGGGLGLTQRGGLGTIFGLFVLETISQSADVGWLGALSPTRYYDPTAILVSGEYDWAGTVILLAGTAALVAVSAWWFRRTDIE